MSATEGGIFYSEDQVRTTPVEMTYLGSHLNTDWTVNTAIYDRVLAGALPVTESVRMQSVLDWKQRGSGVDPDGISDTAIDGRLSSTDADAAMSLDRLLFKVAVVAPDELAGA
jgi:hypothetical protein